MKKLLFLFILTSSLTYSQWGETSVNKVFDTTFYSSTIPDSGVGWGVFTIVQGGTYEGINTGGDTMFYKIQPTTPAVTQRGVPLPNMSSTGLMYLSAGTKIYQRERVNAIYTELTWRWLEN
jgi:hypothetical protein